MSQLEVDQIVNEIGQLIKKAEKIADSCGGSFTINVGNPINVERSIAGTYYGKGEKMCPEDAYYLGYREYADSNPVLVDELDDIEDWEDHDDLDEVTLSKGVWEAWTSSSEVC